MYSGLPRFITARWSNTGLSLVGTNKVKARKSFLFTEGSLKVENKEHLFDFVCHTMYVKTIHYVCASSNLQPWIHQAFKYRIL